MHCPVRHTSLPLPDGQQAILVRRSASSPLRRLWTWLRRQPLTSLELRQAGALFRLQRYGVSTPVLLAVGERHWRHGRTESFLLTEPLPGTVGLRDWLARHAGRSLWAAERKRRWQALRQAGAVLGRIHEAGCCLENAPAVLQVRWHQGTVQVVLGSADGVCPVRGSRTGLAVRDLPNLRTAFADLCSRTDALRFLLGYLGRSRLATADKGLARRLWQRGSGSRRRATA